jgi:ABC-type Fe3+ transport system permease subunit
VGRVHRWVVIERPCLSEVAEIGGSALPVGLGSLFVVTFRSTSGGTRIGALSLRPGSSSPPLRQLMSCGRTPYSSCRMPRTQTLAVIWYSGSPTALPFRSCGPSTTLAALAGLEPSIEEAAQDLGASPALTFFSITLPQIKTGVIAGALFAFIMSWINVEVSIFQTKAHLMTLPVKLFNYVQFNVDPLLAAVSSVTIYLAIAAVFMLDLLIGIEKAGAT